MDINRILLYIGDREVNDFAMAAELGINLIELRILLRRCPSLQSRVVTEITPGYVSGTAFTVFNHFWRKSL